MKNKVAILFAVLVLVVAAIVITKEIKDRNEQRELEETFRAAKFEIEMNKLRDYTDSIEDLQLTETQRILKSIERKLERDK